MALVLRDLSFLTHINVFFPQPRGDGTCRFSSGLAERHQGGMGLPSSGLPSWGGHREASGILRALVDDGYYICM